MGNKMLRLAAIVLGALMLVSGGVEARRYVDAELDCYETADTIECGSSSRGFGSIINMDKAITWVLFVIVVPLYFLRVMIGAFRDSQATDEQWKKLYPAKKLWEREPKIGIGFYLMSACLFYGIGFFWLLFVAPETAKWLYGL